MTPTLFHCMRWTTEHGVILQNTLLALPTAMAMAMTKTSGFQHHLSLPYGQDNEEGRCHYD